MKRIVSTLLALVLVLSLENNYIKSMWGDILYSYNGGYSYFGGGSLFFYESSSFIPLSQMTAVVYSGLKLNSGTSISARASGEFEVIEGYGIIYPLSATGIVP